jgi:uncharacterized protein (TIRG00374 family)
LTDTRPSQGAGSRRRFPPWLIPVLGYSISIACLIWVYRGFDWQSELPRLLATDWRWVSLAVVADILVYVCQGWRWSTLLSPLSRVSMKRSTQAIYIGLFANEVLPLRSGEVIRCYLQRRWSGLPLSVVVSSAVIERLMDGVWLVVGFWVVGYFVELPRLLVEGSKVLMVILGLVTMLLALAILYKGQAHEAASRSPWSRGLRHIIEGVHVMGNSTSFLGAFVLSLAYLCLQVLPIWFLMVGYGLDLTVGVACTVLVILRLGTVIPQAPGNVGSFQALTILGLRLFGIDREVATGFATLLFLVVTVPLWLGGFVALIATRMRFSDIHREAHDEVRASELPQTERPA